jgi:diguanylate cyclase (GGDEF)-like protein
MTAIRKETPRPRPDTQPVMPRLTLRNVAATAMLLLAPASPVSADDPSALRPPAVVRVGVFENPPVVSRGDGGEYEGIAIDVLRSVARREGWTLEWVAGPWAEQLDALGRGEIDLLVGIAYSLERARQFRFTGHSLIGNWGIVYTRPTATIESPLDLTGKRLALMRGSIHSHAFERTLRSFGVRYTPLYVESYEAVFSALQGGQADAGVVNRLFGLLNGARSGVRQTGVVFNPIYVHYAAPMNAGNGVLATLDRHLGALKADKDSIYYASVERWLSAGGTKQLPGWLWAVLAGMAALLGAVLGVLALLRHQVRNRSSELLRQSRALQHEVAKRQRVERHLDKLAFTDGLTELPNRAAFRERLRAALADAERNGTGFALLFVDLDRFKTINDSLGHGAGDTLIRTVAKRLSGQLRDGDEIGRFGGDEFVVYMADVDATEDIEAVAQRLLHVMAQGMNVAGNEIYISASIGIARYPTDSEDIDGLLKDADAAMHAAKESGGNRLRFYSRHLTTRIMERLSIESRLHRALDNDEFSFHYQPIIDLDRSRLVGCEALLRWNDPQRGAVPPGQFLPLVEDSGFIVPLGEWIIERSCAEIAAVNWPGRDPAKLYINVSPRQLEEARLVECVKRALAQAQGRLNVELEITENLFLALTDEVQETLDGLRRLGVRICIDDFGTGYSSLNSLQQLPIETLKIDRTFVANLDRSGSDRTIASTIIAMAQQLELDVVAEGIERTDQLDYLQQHRGLLGQGFLLARPMPLDALQAWLERYIEGKAAISAGG